MTINEQLRSLFILLRKEVLRFFRIWSQTLIPSVLTTILYFLIFGTFIGERIGKMSGFDYMQFMAPGLVMLAVITNAYSNVVSSFFGVKFQRSIEELLVSPMPTYLILIGFVLGGVVRGIIVGFLVLLTSLIFTDITVQNIPLTLLVVVMTAFLFSIAGFLNALFADNFDDINIVPTFILTPLIYLGGVFYSVDLLSNTWQIVSKANPLLYMVNAFRYGMIGVSDINVQFALMMITFFILIFFTLAYYLLKKGYGIRT
ncbi:ABC transporter permease [Gammaproteobacteria bacterium]|jgi:ABC-2 type transport system permease protein|nr:ABC transporter permease [Gammaproteobacteria bacterium]MDC3045728.1 ABC transporter permease [Gammaproteobacteria bacterium]|tara:strand:+ start:37 stop:810 length:774 start_codon:yes stop_codon:yes gene_type:complete